MESRELVQVVVREVGCEREDVSGVAAGSGVVVAAFAAGLVAGRASRLCRKTISRWALAHGFPQKPDASAFRLIVFRQRCHAASQRCPASRPAARSDGGPLRGHRDHSVPERFRGRCGRRQRRQHASRSLPQPDPVPRHAATETPRRTAARPAWSHPAIAHPEAASGPYPANEERACDLPETNGTSRASPVFR